ncbi:HupE/UreJ family protein [Jannaschia formosa]|uniref:HupE/UreJ family protein n=1 Tax=Jannaschia formosa TaxID=2259592 RepID=UPI000E1BF6FC|nr:HupE/UreJ family protein [Jannaschia formosa]TFL18026.1 HupE/UreJ family protein [Jannaschia formosa]
MAGFLWLAGRVLLVAWLSMGLSAAVSAHEVQPAVADVSVGEAQVGIVLRMAVEPVLAGIDLGTVDDTDGSPLGSRNDALRTLPPDELEAALREAWSGIAARIALVSDGETLVPELDAVAVPEVGDVELRRDSTLTLSAALPPGEAPVVLGWDESLGALIVRQVDEGATYEVFLTGGAATEPMPRLGVAEAPLADLVQRYVLSGFAHVIPDGMDHILFVLGLFFYALAWRPLVWQVTAFTVAHMGTLALATTGAITVPSDWMWLVETVIAASIVWIAVENVLGPHERRIGWGRIAVVFVFGLVHGLGFASVLSEFGLGTQALPAFLSFALGLEIGHLTVIAVAYLLLGAPFGGTRFYRAGVVVPGSLIIAAIGAYWVLNRIGWVGDVPLLT